MKLAITEIRWIEVDSQARLRIVKAAEERLCVACMEPLGNQEPIRGVHPRCYRATLRAIESGKCTESQRMEAGKLLEAKRPGRKPSNPVTQDVSSN